ncbi:MAG: hypothetical protein BGN86_15920 [Caulobacterales bacterium 68-7]|nr:hypothetical protein [Caulobacterales bacterium]OJU13174.1 MAG: hypothetical protein BGN86_15920 [Caulobacterales bacterium 68-7]
MRPWLALSLIVALVAGSAGAQTSAPAAKAPAASGPALRGARTLEAQTPRETTAERSARVAVVQPLPPPPAAPTPLMSMLPTREPPLCRTACAQSYYFCLAAGDATEDCSGGFGQCAARCDRPTG